MTVISNIVYIFQSEHYEIMRSLSVIYRLWLKLFSRTSQSPTRTLKAKLATGWALIWMMAGIIWALTFAYQYQSVAAYWYSVIAMIAIIICSPLIFGVMIAITNIAIKRYFRHKAKLAEQLILNTGAIVIGISWSYGKTTMKHILAHMIQWSGKSCIYPSWTINTYEWIIQWVIQYCNKPVDFIVIEMWEYYPGDVDQIAQLVHPHSVIVTGATYQHFERFGTEQKLVDTLLEWVRYIDTQGVTLYNADSQLLTKYIPKDHTQYIAYSNAIVRHVGILPNLAWMQFDYEWVTYQTKLLWSHIPATIGWAIELLKHYGLDQHLQDSISQIQPIEHRMQLRVFGHTDTAILDDAFNGNLEWYKSMIQLINQQSRSWPVIYITPGIIEWGSMSQEIHQTIAQHLCEALISELWLIDTSSTALIVNHLNKNLNYQVKHFATMQQALNQMTNYHYSHTLFVIQNDRPELYVILK